MTTETYSKDPLRSTIHTTYSKRNADPAVMPDSYLPTDLYDHSSDSERSGSSGSWSDFLGDESKTRTSVSSTSSRTLTGSRGTRASRESSVGSFNTLDLMASWSVPPTSASEPTKTKSRPRPSTGSSATTLSKEEKATLATVIDKRKKEISAVFKLIKLSEQVDLCFLLDCTGSMAGEIAGVKTAITRLVTDISKNHTNSKIRVAFVGYTDFDVAISYRLKVLDFSQDVAEFESFVNGVPATGGGDGPEDVQGGFDRLLQLNWQRHATKVMIHIADAPCHGSAYCESGMEDSQLSLDEIAKAPLHYDKSLKAFVDRDIYYYFGRINAHTDKMIDRFNATLRTIAGSTLISQFDVKREGGVQVIAETITTAVSKAVTESILRTVTSASMGPSVKAGKVRSYTITKTEPSFSKGSDFITMAKVKITRFQLPKSVDTISGKNTMSFALDKKGVTEDVHVARKPFAEGSIRLAFHGLIEQKLTKTDKRVVVKMAKSLEKGANSYKRYLLDMETQTISAFLAFAFNDALKKCPTKLDSFTEIKFIVAKVLATVQPGGRPVFAALERLIEAGGSKYFKFNNNAGWVNKDDPIFECLQAFSHFTWNYTKRAHLVVDLQGFFTPDTAESDASFSRRVLLTDPAISSRNLAKFGNTNLGVPGIHKFFKTHKCGPTCSALGLDKVSPFPTKE